ncbi:MAG: hypothetical protein JW895_08590 [Thermoleophilaceae bacterium]|nr:hypothetical protein [Thermoleophilaceae bacterium]
MRKSALTLLVAVALAGAALLSMAGSLGDPVRWPPDGLFYQARSLELRGESSEAALRETFGGPLGAELRRRDPARSGDMDWVRYNTQFYERRVALPAAAAALDPLAGDRALLDLSVAGYVAAVLAIFGLLLLRFRLPIAAAVTLATLLLPALTDHSAYPLTDSWGLALETAALASGLLVLDRGPRWLVPWVASIFVLSLTRDSMWIPIAGAAFLTLRYRSRLSAYLLGSGIAAAIPVTLAFSAPMKELMAMMLNDGIQPVRDPSWGFVAERWPGAVVDLLQADGGYVRDGAWYSAGYLIVGLVLLFALGRSERSRQWLTFLRAAAVAGALSVLVVPIFSAFRLDLVCVPMAAFGLGLGVERVAAAAGRLAWPRVPVALPGRSRT